MTDMQDPDALLMARPILNAEAASQKLSLRFFTPPFRKIRMDRVELVYLPHYLFEIRVEWKRAEERTRAAVDAVLGHHAMWQAEGMEVEAAEGLDFEIPFMIDPGQARQKFQDQHRWVLITAGMKLRKSFEVKEVIPGPRIYYPFWVGYYHGRGQWRFEVVDALSGMRQGGKVRDALLRGWMKK